MLATVALVDFINYLRVRKGRAETTCDTYKYVIAQFIDYMGQNTECQDIKITHIDNYAIYISKIGLRPKTQRNRIVPIKTFIAYLNRVGLSEINKDWVETPKDKMAVIEYLTEDEVDRLLTAARGNTRDFAMLSLLLTSGLRVSELCNLLPSDILGTAISVKNGKGGKHRVTFYNSATEDALKDFMLVRDPGAVALFPNPWGGSLSRMAVLNIVKRYVKNAGIQKHITTHCLRHTFATLYLARGGKIEDLQQIMGHSNIKTTLLYIHFTNSHLHSAYDKVY